MENKLKGSEEVPLKSLGALGRAGSSKALGDEGASSGFLKLFGAARLPFGVRLPSKKVVVEMALSRYESWTDSVKDTLKVC